jgi:tRNA uridine 5-carbamoylmethylation protein Kti12
MGLPGSGKTTLAKLLAEKLNYRYEDKGIALEETSCIIDAPALSKEERDNIKPNFIIWVNTVDKNGYTLEPPDDADIMIDSLDYSIDAVIGRIYKGFT